jgi:AraC-like DNA-binding protein
MRPPLPKKEQRSYLRSDRCGEFYADLRHLLRIELLKEGCSATHMARQFSIQRRTLNRRLSVQGTAFKQVADGIRFEIACELLVHSRLSFGQVAAVLRYSELSAFSRAFRRWSGQTPTAWRASHLRDRDGPTTQPVPSSFGDADRDATRPGG